MQFKSLQEAHEALISENKENLKTIDNLKEQVAFLEKVKPLIEVKSKESQTSFSIEENLSCNECNFIGKVVASRYYCFIDGMVIFWVGIIYFS